MIQKIICLLAAVLVMTIAPNYIIMAQEAPMVEETPTPPSLYSQAAVLMDADTGQVIYGKQMHAKKYPASTTKLMTLLLAMEKGNPSDIVTINDECVKTVPRNTTHIALTQGEQITFEQAEYAMMVESANDAANAVAINLAGTIKNFAEMMNDRAAKLGAKDTHFTNANGLPDDNHYTSAYDMALITKEGLTYPQFRQLAGTPYYEIPPTNKQKDTRKLRNRQYMFCLNDTYPGAFAGKTGWTEEAGKTLVTLAEQNGITLICVVFKASGTVDAEFKDSTALLDYGFQNFKRVNVPADFFGSTSSAESLSSQPEESFFAESDMPILLPNTINVQDLTYELNTVDAQNPTVTLKAPESAGTFMDTTVGIFPISKKTANTPVFETDIEPVPAEKKINYNKIWITIGSSLLILFLIAVAGILLLRLYVLRCYRAKMRRKIRSGQPIKRKNSTSSVKIIDVTMDKAHKNKMKVIDQDKL